MKLYKGKIGENPVDMELFDNIADFSAQVGNRALRAGEVLKQNEGFHCVNGVHNEHDAWEMLRNGYAPALKGLKSAVQIAEREGRDAGGKRTWEQGMAGALPIVPAAVMGLPNSMLYQRRVPNISRHITVVYDVGLNSGVTSDKLETAGKDLMGALVQMEKQGFSIDLYMAFASENDKKHIYGGALHLRRGDSVESVTKLTYPLCHPSFFRLNLFKQMRSMPEAPYMKSGLGIALADSWNVSKCEEFFKTVLHEQQTVYFSARSIIKDRKNAIQNSLARFHL